MDSMRRSFYYIFLFFDITMLILSFSAADLISRGRLPQSVLDGFGQPGLPEIFTLLIFLTVWFFSSRITALYDELKNVNFSSEVFTLFQNILIQLISGVVILFALKDILLSRFFFMLYLVFASAALVFLRGVHRLVKRKLIRSGKLKKNVLLIGSGDPGNHLFGTPDRALAMGYHISGFVSETPPDNTSGYLGTFDDIADILSSRDIDEALITLNAGESSELDKIVGILSGFPVRARIVPEYTKFISSKYQISFLNNTPVIDIRNDPLDELHWRIIKRGFDIVFSLVFIIFIFSWLGVLIAIGIKINSRGPVLFKQERWGRKNRKFTVLKFRSMVRESSELDEQGKFRQTTKGDSRVTEFGKFLRRTSLDEIPQFFNVLKGEMSVVGPRPHPVPMNIESKDNIANYMLRHLVKPGITGWAQVKGFRGEITDKKLLEKRIGHDMFYIEHWSLLFDLRIIVLTIWRGLKGDPNAY